MGNYLFKEWVRVLSVYVETAGLMPPSVKAGLTIKRSELIKKLKDVKNDIENNNYGYVFDTNDLKNLSEVIHRILYNDEERFSDIFKRNKNGPKRAHKDVALFLLFYLERIGIGDNSREKKAKRSQLLLFFHGKTGFDEMDNLGRKLLSDYNLPKIQENNSSWHGRFKNDLYRSVLTGWDEKVMEKMSIEMKRKKEKLTKYFLSIDIGERFLIECYQIIEMPISTVNNGKI